MEDRDSGFDAQKRLLHLLQWISTHPSVLDVDETSELAMNELARYSGEDNAAACDEAQLEALEGVADLLSELLDVVGNCETEEKNLKLRLWSEIVSRAQTACDVLQMNE